MQFFLSQQTYESRMKVKELLKEDKGKIEKIIELNNY